MSFNIAIDGPAGAGKTTVARAVAEALSFIYVDTGAMYRAIALGILRRSVDIENPANLETALKEIEVSIKYQDKEQHVYLNGEDVSSLIRTGKVSKMTSRTSALPQVRGKLMNLQQDLARHENVVMDGRDIGTMILPDADLKIYMTASVGTRAYRRYLEQKGKGEQCSLEEITEEIRDRDYRDSHREIAPLCQADDAILIDTSDMTADEAVDEILKLVRERRTTQWK